MRSRYGAARQGRCRSGLAGRGASALAGLAVVARFFRVEFLGPCLAGLLGSVGFGRILPLRLLGSRAHLARIDELALVLVVAARGFAIAFTLVLIL